MTRTDKYLIAGVLMFSLIILFANNYIYAPALNYEQVVVKVQGKPALHIDMPAVKGPQQYTVKGKQGNVIVEVREQKVRMLEAVCPDQICVRQGWIDTPGKSIICVPNEIVIYFDSSGKKPPVDAIIR